VPHLTRFDCQKTAQPFIFHHKSPAQVIWARGLLFLQLGGDVQGDFHHIGEIVLALFGACRFSGDQGIGYREDSEGFHFVADAPIP
jgi:hypothetical protein